jgi:hypothetical protein
MEPHNRQAVVIARGLAGAALGAVLGWFGFNWFIDQGFYALVLPGALIGMLCGAFAGGVSWVNAAICAVIALAEGLVLEWKHFPFVADESFEYFLSHLHELRGMTWLMLIVGGALALWFGRGRVRVA